MSTSTPRHPNIFSRLKQEVTALINAYMRRNGFRLPLDVVR